MTLSTLRGLIRRRLLVNYRVDPDVLRLLPAPFRPSLVGNWGVAGICLIRIEQLRPSWLPARVGLSSENAAHRIAVCWTDADGTSREGVFIPRRDTGSLITRWAGGRIFPGEHHRARFTVRDLGGRLELRVRSVDGVVAVDLRCARAVRLPATSVFGSLAAASAFFERGSLGYSARATGARLDGLRLVTRRWRVEPLAVEDVQSSFFDDPARFPRGTVEFDCALLMRDVEHSWHGAPPLMTRARGTAAADRGVLVGEP